MRIIIFVFFIMIIINNSILCLAIEKEIQTSKMLTSPHFYNIGSTTSNSVLTMECGGEKPYNEIECYFTEIVIMIQSDDQKIKYREETSQIINKLTKEDIENNKGRPELLKKYEELLSLTSTPEKKAYFLGVVDILKAESAAKDKSHLFQAIKDFTKKQEDTCSIRVFNYSNIMRRVTKNRWTSDLYGAGVRTIENRPDNELLWKYTELTNDNPSKILIFTSETPTTLAPGCKYLSFSGIVPFTGTGVL